MFKQGENDLTLASTLHSAVSLYLGYNYNFFQNFTHTIKVEKAMVERYDYDPDLQMEQGELPELPGSGILFNL